MIVPAHDERANLPAALQAIRRAAASAPVPVEVVVVLDACTDGTTVPEPAADVVLEVQARNVGAARRAGMTAALRTGPAGLWLMCTDADSLVPVDWVERHLHHAARGADLVVGTVKVADWTGWSADLAGEYQRRYLRRTGRRGHGHVHGTNLGISATAYQELGGFAELTTGEDVDLVRRARRRRLRVLSALDVPVTTSARADPRAPDGFGAYLHRTALEVLPAVPAAEGAEPCAVPVQGSAQ